MNIKGNILNYLYDRDYIVTMYEDFVYIFNYKYLEQFDENKIVVILPDRKISLFGSDMLIIRITKEELLIRGKVTKIEAELKK